MQRFRRWPATHLDMKWFVLMSVVAVAACLNPVSVGTVDGGCSEADCYVMSDACRAESALDPNPTYFDGCGPWHVGLDGSTITHLQNAYCMKTCRARPSVAAQVVCVAAHATDCRNDYDAGRTPDEVFAACTPDAGQLDQACDDRCTMARAACQAECGGGASCRQCLIAGQGTADCSGVCPDGGYVGCMDCSAACGLAYGTCTDSCYH